MVPMKLMAEEWKATFDWKSGEGRSTENTCQDFSGEWTRDKQLRTHTGALFKDQY